MDRIPPQVRTVIALAEILAAAAELAGQRLAKSARRALRGPARRGAYRARHPGPDTPHWNALVGMLGQELRDYGSKARVARYLGVPRQRVSDFVSGRSRLPDAEVALQLLGWLAHKRTGRDDSL